MNQDPQRLRDDPQSPAGLRALLKEASPPPPLSDASKAASAAAVATLVTGQAAAATATVTATAGASAGIKLWLVVGGVAALGMVGAGVAVTSSGLQAHQTGQRPDGAVSPPGRMPASAVAEDPRPSVPSEPFAEPAEPPSEALSETALPDAPPSVSPVSPATPATANSRNRAATRGAAQDAEPSSPNESGLVAEAALLERARRLLRSNPAGALAETTRHARTFPRARLASERDIIAIDALRRLGRTSAARRRARRLISRAPNGIYADRARAMLGDLTD